SLGRRGLPQPRTRLARTSSATTLPRNKSGASVPATAQNDSWNFTAGSLMDCPTAVHGAVASRPDIDQGSVASAHDVVQIVPGAAVLLHPGEHIVAIDSFG